MMLEIKGLNGARDEIKFVTVTNLILHSGSISRFMLFVGEELKHSGFSTLN